MALLGPWLIHAVAGDEPESLDKLLKECIGFALLFAAGIYALRLLINLYRVRRGDSPTDDDPPIRPLPTLLVRAPWAGSSWASRASARSWYRWSRC